MTTNNSAGVEYPARFHTVKVSSDNGDMVVAVELDVTADPFFMGDRPERTEDGNCSTCGQRWIRDVGLHLHVASGEYVPAEEFHRYPEGSREPGFYSDELEAFQK